MRLVHDHITELFYGFLMHPLIKLAKCTVKLGISILRIKDESFSE